MKHCAIEVYQKALALSALAALAGCVGVGAKNVAATAEKDKSPAPLRVAVFVDSGARNIGAFRWVELTARAKGVAATPVDGAAVRSGALDAADVLVMPGGSSVDEAKSLGAEGREKVREFVRGGGGYVGTCAGCCLLMEPSKDHPDMLHMIPFKFGPHGGYAEISIAFNRRAEELAGLGKRATKIRYSEGPVPLPSLPVKDSDVEVIATYNGDINAKSDKGRPSMAGQAAAIAGTYGKGRLFVLSVHPEYDVADHYVLQRAFKFVTGRRISWDYPQRRRGQLAVGLMCDGSFGVETSRLVQRLVTEGEFDIVPLNRAQVRAGWLRRVDAVLAPAVARAEKPEGGLYGDNAGRTKEFLARGGRIYSWGNAAKAAREREGGVACVADAEAALAALRALAAEPAPTPAALPAKVEKPIRAGIFQSANNSNLPIATLLDLAPEYELKFLGPKDYANGGLDGLDLVIQPGGGSTSQYRAIGEKGAEALKLFVLDGGKYYGVSAGAFLALQQTSPDAPRLGLVPFKGDDPAHRRGSAPVKVTLTGEGLEAFSGSATNRTVLYVGGPAAVPGDPVADSDVKVLAKYAGCVVNTDRPDPVEPMAGKAAFLGGRVGKGKVFLSCLHPENEESNCDLVRNGIGYLTGVVPSPAHRERVRGAVSVMYWQSNKASAEFLFNTLVRDSRFCVWPGRDLNDLPHVEAVVLTGKATDAEAKALNRYVARGGRVVAVCDTPKKREAAKKLKGAVVVDSYDKVVEAIAMK